MGNKIEIKCNDTLCSGDAEFVKLPNKKSRGFVRCTKCGKEGRAYSDKYAAIRAWNREAVLSEQQKMTQQE